MCQPGTWSIRFHTFRKPNNNKSIKFNKEPPALEKGYFSTKVQRREAIRADKERNASTVAAFNEKIGEKK